MAKFNVVDMNGQHVSEIELSDAVFGITPNEKAVHIAVDYTYYIKGSGLTLSVTS